jgi:hypothetical protein
MNDAAGWYKMATMMRTTDGSVIRGGYGETSGLAENLRLVVVGILVLLAWSLNVLQPSGC